MGQAGWRKYLRFSRRERWAVSVLVVLTLLAWTLPFLGYEHPSPPVLSPWPKEPDQPTGTIPSHPKVSGVTAKGRGSTIRPFPFDPNTLDQKGWLDIGLPPRKVATLLKYRARGGRFLRPEDLAKVYSLSAVDVAILTPYVRIHTPADRQTLRKHGRDSFRFSALEGAEQAWLSPPRRLEVNAADSLAWVKLPGIGPGWASRILRFRRSLGGFVTVGQVAETYGLPDSVFLSIRPYLHIDTLLIAKIDINHATAEQLAAHPYLSHRVARAIVAYRERHGPFGRVEELGRLALVSPELLARLRPYLRWE
ncbi:MAG: hypothetical protein EBZ67_12485 [Chitinophagia bacterium]|nr:hypothetical protein [Chitinophagia bacterium]